MRCQSCFTDSIYILEYGGMKCDYLSYLYVFFCSSGLIGGHCRTGLGTSNKTSLGEPTSTNTKKGGDSAETESHHNKANQQKEN